MKILGFKKWLARRGAADSVRAVGFVDPARIRAVTPSPSKTEDFGTVASWNRSLSQANYRKMTSRLRGKP